MHRDELENHLNQLLDISRFHDYCPNGLQVEGRDSIHILISGVTASLDLLQAAVMRPAASAFGMDAYPGLRDKVAALLHSVARNHPFADGNKRTAAIAGVFMFAVNGERIVWAQPEAVEKIVSVAEGQTAVADLAAWFPLEAQPPALQPDAETDMRLIAGIMDEQRWLLDELERR